MRDYAKVVPTFWTGKTGKALRARGSEALVVGMYLMTSPHSNMLGLFYQPVLYMAHETGLGEEGARKGLQGAIEAGFCSFDEASEMVWVHEMAAYQIASELKATDNRCAGIQKDFDALPDNPFLGGFFAKYQAAFHLKKARPEEAPSKPLRSQEQEQEKEQEKESSAELFDLQPNIPPPPPLVTIPLVDGSEHPVHSDDIERWSETYPAVDVLPELRRMREWCIANPTNRKTARGVGAFIVRWLGKTQDKGGTPGYSIEDRSPTSAGVNRV